MLKRSNSQSTILLGVDINASYIKIVEPSWNDNNFQIVNHASLLLPKNVVEHGVIKNKQTVTDTIDALLSTQTFSTKKVALAIPDGIAVNRILQVRAGLSAEDLTESVKIEIVRNIPVPLDELFMDYIIINSSLDYDIIYVVATRKENVLTRVAAVCAAGLQVLAVELESLSIFRSLRASLNLNWQYNQYICFLVGISQINVIVTQENRVIFANEEAIIQNEIENITQQLWRILQVCLSSNSEQCQQEILLCVDPRYDYGLLEKFQQIITLPMQVIEPLENWFGYKKISNTFLVACGLALRGCKFYGR